MLQIVILAEALSSDLSIRNCSLGCERQPEVQLSLAVLLHYITYWVGQFDPRFWDPLCNQRQTSTSGPEPDISSHRISINIWINMKETSETCCDFIFTCFCRVMRSQSSTSQGFNSSGIFTFTSTRLVNISSWIHTHTI